MFLRLSVDQWGIDLVIHVIDTAGIVVAQIDRPNGTHGPESVSIITTRRGLHELRLRAAGKPTLRSTYALRVLEYRHIEPSDHTRIAAEQRMTNGQQHWEKGTADSLALAREAFQAACLDWIVVSDSYETGLCHYGLGLVHRSMGHAQLAVSAFRSSLVHMISLTDHHGQAMALTGIAWCYLHMGQTTTAIQQFSHALISRRMVGDRRGEALTLFGLASAQAESAGPISARSALGNMLLSLNMRRSIGEEREIGLSLVGIGKLYGMIGDRNAAVRSLESGLKILRQVPHRQGMSDALVNLSHIGMAAGTFTTAAGQLDEAIALARAAGDATGERRAYVQRAAVASAMGELDGAIKYIRMAIRSFERQRSQGGSNVEFRTTELSRNKGMYELALDLLMAKADRSVHRQYAEEAFMTFESELSRTLTDRIADAARSRPVPIALVQKREAIVKDLVRLGKLYQSGYGGQATAPLEIAERRSAYYAVEADIQNTVVRVPTNVSPLHFVDIQTTLLTDDETVVVAIGYGTTKSYLWVIGRHEFHWHTLPARRHLEPLVDSLLHLITERNRVRAREPRDLARARVAKADKAFVNLSEVVYKTLFSPVRHLISGKRLVIVTEGKLLVLPFAALRTGPGRYLVEDSEVLLAPSCSAILASRAAGSEAPDQWDALVLFDPVYSTDDSRLAGLQPANSARTSDLLRLYASAWEAEALLDLLAHRRTVRIEGFAATGSALTAALTNRRYRIMHFATHAIIDHNAPELSRLALAQFDRNGRAVDDDLRAYEIAALHTVADLVVLGGCQTARGRHTEGEGIEGVMRGFLLSGAKRVIGTGWQIRDADSAEFLALFYRTLLLGTTMSPSGSLRSAQRQFAKGAVQSSPYYWAAFAMWGDWLPTQWD